MEFREIRKEWNRLRNVANLRIARSKAQGLPNLLTNREINPYEQKDPITGEKYIVNKIPTIAEFNAMTEQQQKATMIDWQKKIKQINKDITNPMSSVIGVKDMIRRKTGVNPYEKISADDKQGNIKKQLIANTINSMSSKLENWGISGKIAELWDKIDALPISENAKKAFKAFVEKKLHGEKSDYDDMLMYKTPEEIIENFEKFAKEFDSYFSDLEQADKDFFENLNPDLYDNPTDATEYM